jgi:excisionase family DNA binding protein
VSTTASPSGPWLSLGEASRLLGITPATLRRWTDQGQVATFVTPGGHRRFPRSVIEGLVPHPRTRRPPLAGLANPKRLALAYRRARLTHRPASMAWLGALTDADREEFRQHGRRLLAMVFEHLDAEDKRVAATRLEETVAAAHDYGEVAGELGASLAETVSIFLCFRSSFAGELAGIARRRGLDTREATGLLLDAEDLMDRLLLALMEGHRD